MHKQIMNSSLIFLGVSLLQALMQLVMLPLQTHYLSPSQYGILATVIACSALFNFLLNLGFQGAAQRFVTDYKNTPTEHNILWSTVLFLTSLSSISIGFLMLMILFLNPLNFLGGFIDPRYLTYGVVHSMAMGILLVGAELLTMYQQPRRYALAYGTMYLSYIPFNVFFVATLHWQVNGALLTHAIVPWIGCVILILTNLDSLKWDFHRRLSRELLTYSVKVLPHFIFSTLNSIADRLLITFILGKYFTGIYSAGSMVASLMPLIVGVIASSTRPQIYAKFSQNTTASLKEVHQLSITAIVIIAFIGTNIALWSPETLLTLTGPSYHNAWPVSILLTLKYMIQALAVFSLCSVMFNKLEVHKLLFVTGSTVLVLFLCSALLAPLYGIWGIAIASLISTLHNLYFTNRLAKKTFNMSWPIVKMMSIITVFFIPACGLIGLTILAGWTLWFVVGIKLIFSLTSLFATALVISKQYRTSIPSLLTTLSPKYLLKS